MSQASEKTTCPWGHGRHRLLCPRGHLHWPSRLVSGRLASRGLTSEARVKLHWGSHLNKDNVDNSLICQSRAPAATDRVRTSRSRCGGDERPGLGDPSAASRTCPLLLQLRVIPSSMQTLYVRPSRGPVPGTISSANSHPFGVEKNKPQRAMGAVRIFHFLPLLIHFPPLLQM